MGDAPSRLVLTLSPASIHADSGLGWQVRGLGLPRGDDLRRPKHSRLVVHEDGAPLGPAHALHDQIRKRGNGRYSHWIDWLYFSTSDGSDPRSNGRVYQVFWRDEDPPPSTVDAERRRQTAHLIASVADGIDVTALTQLQSQGCAEARAWTFQQLGDAFAESGQDERAAMQYWRAWQLGRRQHALWHPIRRWLQDSGQPAALDSLFRTAVMAANQADDPDWLTDVIIEHEVHVFGQYERTRTLPFQDDVILESCQSLLSRHRLNSRPLTKTGPLRVGYLLTGEGETKYCSLAEIAIEMVLAHDPDRVQACALSLHDRQSVLAGNPLFAGWLDELEQAGRPMHFLGSGLAGHCFHDTVELARAIDALGLDVLVFAGQCGLRLLLAGLRPAPMMVGLGLGEVQLYTSRLLDLTVHINIKPAMDGFGPSALAPSFMPRGRFAQPQQPVSRAELQVPEEAVLLMCSARPVKYREPMFWQVMTQVLSACPDAWLALVGLDPTTFAEMAVTYAVPVALHDRIRPLGWRCDHQAVLCAADLFVDTFPNGGGYTVFEALSLGIATLAIDDDYLLPFEERSWAVAAEIVGGGISVPGRPDRILARLVELVNDPSSRQDLARNAPLLADAVRSPVPCTRAFEGLIEQWRRDR